MSASKRKPHYRIKPLPVLVAALVFVILIALLVRCAAGDGDSPSSGSAGPQTEGASSDPSSSDALSAPSGSEDTLPGSAGASSGADDASSDVTDVPSDAADASSDSTNASSDVVDVSSETSSLSYQDPDNIPAAPVTTGDGTITYNGTVYAEADLPAGSTSDWNLILLNPEENNKIDAELSFERAEFDGQLCDARAADAFQDMKDACQEEIGQTLFLRSGYRSIATQDVNYNAALQRYLDQGYSEAEALERTNAYYTVAGHSEHHTGLAFDTITPEYHRDVWSLDDRFADTEAYAWLSEHCWDYGFILRYPEDKQDITRIHFEPWHYRYVGVEHAQFMRDHNLCLEEYIALLKAAGR